MPAIVLILTIHYSLFVIIKNEHAPIKDSKKNKTKDKERTLAEKGSRYHYYFKRTGRYAFIGKNLLRLIVILGAFALSAWAFFEFVIDLEQIEKLIFSRLPTWLIVGTLFISECFTGILPPDMYIIWAKTLDEPYLMVFILALSSYIGGIISWIIGTQLHRLERVKKWVDVKFEEQFKLFKKYGGLVIFVSALTPLPFSPVSVVAGIVEYPFKSYLIVALSRFLRFFLYAFVIYQIF